LSVPNCARNQRQCTRTPGECTRVTHLLSVQHRRDAHVKQSLDGLAITAVDSGELAGAHEQDRARAVVGLCDVVLTVATTCTTHTSSLYRSYCCRLALLRASSTTRCAPARASHQTTIIMTPTHNTSSRTVLQQLLDVSEARRTALLRAEVREVVL
jgi:hypothetical protein